MQKLGMNLDNVNKIKDFLRKVVYTDGIRVFDEKTLDNLFRKTTVDGNDIFFIKYESQPTIKRKVEDFYKMVKGEAARVETTMMEIIRKNRYRAHC
jgi:endo-alpha-1,4-polygalactosaminidase (GH114 family)